VRGRPAPDFIAVFALVGLKPATRYEVAAADGARADTPADSTTIGGFMPAPIAGADAAAVFAVISCQHYDHRGRADGFSIYVASLSREPDFFVNPGDAVY